MAKKKAPVEKKTNLTLQDVANACGVSRQVVSAIVSQRKGSSGYSEETRQRVLEAIEKIGYRPHRGSLSLKKRRHGNVALLFSSFFHMPSDIFLTTLAKSLVERDYQVVLEPKLPKWQDQRFLREDNVDAVITFQDIPEEMHAQMQRLHIPCLSVNSNFNLDIPKITYDDDAGTRLLVEQLRLHGRRNIAYLIQRDQNSPYEKPRIDAMAELDKQLPGMQCSSYITESTRNSYGGSTFHNIDEIFEKNPALDGLILSNYRAQPGVMEELQKLGKRVPEDISLLSFFAPQVGPAKLAVDPAGVIIDGDELAAAMGDMLETITDGAVAESQVMSYHWLAGGSL